MVSVVDIVGLLVLLGVNSAISALMTRFFRVRLKTRWGSLVYTGLLVPVVLTVTTLVIGGFLGLGPNLGSTNAVLGVAIFLPMALGVSFDYFWMPSPEELDLPEKQNRRKSRREL